MSVSDDADGKVAKDDFFQEAENEDEKRLRMTKALIEEVRDATKTNDDEFVLALQSEAVPDANMLLADDDDAVKKALKMKVL